MKNNPLYPLLSEHELQRLIEKCRRVMFGGAEGA